MRSARPISPRKRSTAGTDVAGNLQSLRCTSRSTIPSTVRWRLSTFFKRLNCLAWASPPALRRRFLPSLAKVCFSAMPARLAAATTLARAISSRRESTGWAMAFSWTVVSTITRSNSAGLIALEATPVSIVSFTNSSTPPPARAQDRAEAPDLGGVAGQAWLVEGHAAEELPLHVLGPALDQFLVAELV